MSPFLRRRPAARPTAARPTGSGRGGTCCTEGARLSRRSLLGGALAGLMVVPALELIDGHVAYAIDTSWTGDTLVVLSLRGGMDGLSAVVPAGDPAYYTNRPGIAVPSGSLLQLDGYFGLHPAMAALKPLYDAGRFAPVVATGLAQPNRSHFEAMSEMEAANPGAPLRTGWLGRLLGAHTSSNATFTAVQVGDTGLPTSLRAASPANGALGVGSVADFSLTTADDAHARAAWTAALTTLHSGEPSPTANATSLTASVARTLAALDTAAAVDAAYPAYDENTNPGYPDTDLGRALADVARLIKADVGLKVATLDMGDWDMHSGLGERGGGWMNDNLTDLATALATFATDLGSRLSTTTLVTISEFGRRVEENESGGLDHGWGNLMMVLGGHVVQKVHGSWPTLAENKLSDGGDLVATTDYRAVFADILAHRCGAGPDLLTEVFPKYDGIGSLPGITAT